MLFEILKRNLKETFLRYWYDIFIWVLLFWYFFTHNISASILCYSIHDLLFQQKFLSHFFFSLKLIVLFCFTVREEFLSDSSYDTGMTFFSLSWNSTEESETIDLSIILSNFRMFCHSFCSKVRRGIGLETILTRKLASLPQNLFCHNPLREIFPNSWKYFVKF